MLDSVLVANRGEIACRVIRTARRLGLRTIAVYSEADRDALHVRLADLGLAIGPAPARESYLNVPAIIAAARATGARCIHPGYGFLSENARFARACAEAGVVFVGPPESSILQMGSKSEARRLMAAAGVPVLRLRRRRAGAGTPAAGGRTHGFSAADQAHGGRRR
jgi:3-methylcrotonyl-CoA carboxylase alpha subunit